jgi:hypothetical protein
MLSAGGRRERRWDALLASPGVAAALDDACSARSLAAGEPLAATAVTDDRWLLLEQDGPWGPKPPAGSDLDPGVATELARRCEALGIRLGLLRRTTARAPGGPRVCYLASTARGAPWLERHLLHAPAGVLGLDLEALAAGRPTAPGAACDRPVWAVCTHGERDACCARLGRALHRALCAARPDDTWQTSHLGGHRFAPTLVHLPSGTCLGRVPPARASEVAGLLDAGRLPVDLLRGRAGDAWAVQAADCLVRAERGLDALDAVEVLAADGDEVALRAAGETLRVTVGREPLPQARPASCGKADEPAERPVLRALAPLPAARR